MANLADHVRASFELADSSVSKASPEILAMRGMSGTKTRHLYNNLCNFPGCRLLEIGCWRGSSTVSALYGNEASAVVIDNWSEFGGPKADFMANVRTFLKEHVAGDKIEHMDEDCWDALARLRGTGDESTEAKFSVYLYDAGHTEDDHRRGIVEALGALTSPCIVIVDDWSWPQVQAGTMAGIEESGARVLYSEERKTEFETPEGYWNGTGVFVLEHGSAV